MQPSDSERPPWAPENMPPGAVELVEFEQWLQSAGLREILLQVTSNDSAEFIAGAKKLRAYFVNVITQAREDERDNAPGGAFAPIALVAVFAFGAALGAIAWWAFG